MKSKLNNLSSGKKIWEVNINHPLNRELTHLNNQKLVTTILSKHENTTMVASTSVVLRHKKYRGNYLQNRNSFPLMGVSIKTRVRNNPIEPDRYVKITGLFKKHNM